MRCGLGLMLFGALACDSAIEDADGRGMVLPASANTGGHTLAGADDGDEACTQELPVLRGEAGRDGSPDTAGAILEKLLSVDGSGSGLDADRIDGVDTSGLAEPGHVHEDLAELVHSHGAAYMSFDHDHGCLEPGHNHDGVYVRTSTLSATDAGTLTGGQNADGLHSHPSLEPRAHNHDGTYLGSHTHPYAEQEHGHDTQHTRTTSGVHAEVVHSTFTTTKQTLFELPWMKVETHDNGSADVLILSTGESGQVRCHHINGDREATNVLIDDTAIGFGNGRNAEVYCSHAHEHHTLRRFLMFHGAMYPGVGDATIMGIAISDGDFLP